jgi:hypothetical protein
MAKTMQPSSAAPALPSFCFRLDASVNAAEPVTPAADDKRHSCAAA